jgi:hypothetical protein
MTTLIRIAKTGLFNMGAMTPIEAAGEANLWEAMAILNYENAQDLLATETQKEAEKERKNKR